MQKVNESLFDLKDNLNFKESVCVLSFFKKRFYLFIFREKEREGERERALNVQLLFMYPRLGTWPATQECTPNGNRTSNPTFLPSFLPSFLTPSLPASLPPSLSFFLSLFFFLQGITLDSLGVSSIGTVIWESMRYSGVQSNF